MPVIFPNSEWIAAFKDKLNSDERYGRSAVGWEGKVLFIIERDSHFPNQQVVFLDLWHGECREAAILEEGLPMPNARFVLQAPYSNFLPVLRGEIHPMTALTTRKLRLKGDLAYIVRHLPVSLEFVRCAQEITTAVSGQ